MRTFFLDRVREVCQEVAGRAKYVRVDRDRIADYAASITDEELRLPELDPDYHYLGHGEDTAAYVVTLATINYGSGYFPALKKSVESSGYFTIARALKERFEQRGPLTVDELARIDADDCGRIFGQRRRDKTVRELMKQYAMSLAELGRHLLDRHHASFYEFLQSAAGSAERLAECLATMSRFDDVAFYGDLDVAFYKRAQLGAADLSLAFGGEGLGGLEDLDSLTLFADNQVPHVLRVDGVLVYDSSLARHIESGSLIPAQSTEEVEIRACAVHAGELIVAELRRAGREANAMALDYFLWNRGLDSKYRSQSAHLTKTIFY